MPMCCVCGKEADCLTHGLWWCETHHPQTEEQSVDKMHKGVEKKEKQSQGNLGLEWV